MEILLQRVLYLCKKYNVSIYSVQKATHLSDGAIKRWDKSPPSSDRLLRVAQYFGVSTDFLLGYTDNPKSHLNRESVDLMLNEVKTLIDDWESQFERNKTELERRYYDVKKKYGISNDAGIEIDCIDVMSDPNLPRS